MALQGNKVEVGRFSEGMYVKSEHHVHESLARTCGVCMDVILTKQNPSERVFAILPNCQHCFCLHCIQTWRRKTDVVSYNGAKGCPECRTVSFYFIPSKCWVTDQDEKNEIISLYKTSILSKITCKIFSRRQLCVWAGLFLQAQCRIAQQQTTVLLADRHSQRREVTVDSVTRPARDCKRPIWRCCDS